MTAVAGPSNVNNENSVKGPPAHLWDRRIQSGDTVLLRLPNAEFRSIKLESDTFDDLLLYFSHAAADVHETVQPIWGSTELSKQMHSWDSHTGLVMRLSTKSYMLFVLHPLRTLVSQITLSTLKSSRCI